MAICGCALPARCYQPAVAGGFIYADLRGEFSTHLALQALFTQSSPVMQISGVTLALTCPHRLCLLRVLCMSHCYKLSPFQAHWGRWHCTSFLRPVCLFTVHVGSGSYPLSCGVFLPLPFSQAFLLLVAGRMRPRSHPLRPGLACLFRVPGGIPLHPSSELRRPTLFIVLIAYYSVSLFSLGGIWSVQGPMLIWPRVVCGSTMYPLAHLVRVSLSHLAMGDWRWPWGPPGFSIQCEVEMLFAGWGCGGSKFCLFLVALPSRCVSSVSPRFHFRRHSFCFLPLAAILALSESYIWFWV
jgi:hypothetical protein